MMLKREFIHSDGNHPSALRRRVRVGSAVIVMSAGASVIWTGSTSAALANVNVVGQTAGTTACHALPAPPSSSPSPTPTPTGSSSSSPSPTPSTPSATSSPIHTTALMSGNQSVTQLCVTVQATENSVEVGHTAAFQIKVWPIGGSVTSVAVKIAANSGFPAATFTTCGVGDGTATCSVGGLDENQATQLDAQMSVPSNATTSAAATLAATASGTATGATSGDSVSTSAEVTVTPVPKPPPTKHHSGGGGGKSSSGSGGGSGSSGSGSTQDLGLGLGGGGTTPSTPQLNLTNPTGNGSEGDPSGLFPTIGPSSSPSPSSHGSKSLSGPYKPTTVADVLPLNTSQVGSQVAGLVVLAIGIVIAVARVSLRKPKAATKD